MSNLLFRTVSEKLNQPTGIAVIASVGIHVILGLTLPSYVPVFSNEAPPTRRTVQMLELSEADLSRLPDLSVPTVPPYIYQQTPLTSPFPPLPPLSRQDSLRLNGTTSTTPPSQESQRPSSSSTRKRIGQTVLPGESNPKFSPHRLERMSAKELRDLVKKVAAASPLNPTIPDPNNPNDGSSASNPNSRTTVDKLASEINKLPPEDFQPKKNPTVAMGEPNPESTEAETSPEGELSSTNPPQQEPNLKPDDANTPPDQIARRTSDDPDNQAEISPPQQRTLIAEFPKAACQKQLNGTAIYNVTVNTDGKPTNLQLLQGAGDSILDQQAQERVNTQRFERTDQPQEYQVSVQFSGQDKVCPKPTPPEPSNQNPEGSNSPTPQPENPEASEESNSNNSPSSNQQRSDRDPVNSGEQSPSETTSESEAPKDQPEESANPAEESPEASNPPDVVVPTL
ncbi:MAG: TonB family protein [Coleofasciculus sp. A1-SPW-01]|uniref:TonB family protein n=1 Tax=Coleofasciculus sp. A1-SPW-01 TaxID=3070819 RepID=UPI0032F5ACE0